MPPRPTTLVLLVALLATPSLLVAVDLFLFGNILRISKGRRLQASSSDQSHQSTSAIEPTTARSRAFRNNDPPQQQQSPADRRLFYRGSVSSNELKSRSGSSSRADKLSKDFAKKIDSPDAKTMSGSNVVSSNEGSQSFVHYYSGSAILDPLSGSSSSLSGSTSRLPESFSSRSMSLSTDDNLNHEELPELTKKNPREGARRKDPSLNDHDSVGPRKVSAVGEHRVDSAPRTNLKRPSFPLSSTTF